METKIKKQSASYTIGTGTNQSLSVEINLANKQFTIEDKSGSLKSKGIGISIGGASDIESLKQLIAGINSAVVLIEKEFEELKQIEEEEAKLLAEMLTEGSSNQPQTP